MAPEPGEHVTLTSEAVRSAAAERLRPLMAGISTGYRVSPEVLLDVLVYAAATGTSLHSAAAALESVADDTTLRDYLNAACRPDNVLQLEAQVNKLLLAEVPKELFEVRQDLAIDFHDLPFYGRVSDLDGWLCRGKARDGTTHFVRVATAYVMRDGLRFTLAVRFVRPSHQTADILSSMLVRLRRAGVKIACLWLDRGFAGVGVVQRLEPLRIPAVIACPIRGEQGGTRALCRGRASDSTAYTMHGPHGTWCSVPVPRSTATSSVAATNGERAGSCTCGLALASRLRRCMLDTGAASGLSPAIAASGKFGPAPTCATRPTATSAHPLA